MKEALKMAFNLLEEFIATNGYWWQEFDEETIAKIAPTIRAIEEALAQPAQELVAWMDRDGNFSDNNDHNCFPIPLYATAHPIPPQQEPVVWKLVPTEPTEEMLKAMDECSTEGYDERLYAGHAASVYMAAIDATPTPPQRTEERNFCPRCGKRTADLTVIHTCTPPRGNT